MRRLESPPEAIEVEADPSWDVVLQDYTIYSFMSTSKKRVAPAWLLAMHEIVEREAQAARASRKRADSSGDGAKPKGAAVKRSRQLAVMETARRTRQTAVNNPSPLVRKNNPIIREHVLFSLCFCSKICTPRGARSPPSRLCIWRVWWRCGLEARAWAFLWNVGDLLVNGSCWVRS